VLSSTFLTVWENIEGGLTLAREWFDATLPAALAALQAVWERVWPALLTAYETMQAAVGTGIEMVKGWFTSDVPGALSTLQETWTSVTTAMQTVWDALVAFLMPTVQRIIDAFPLMIASFAPVGPKFQELWSLVQPVILKLNAFLGVALVVAVKLFGETIAVVMPHVGTVVATVLDALILAFRAVDVALTALLGVFQKHWPAIQAAVENAWASIRTAFEAVSVWLLVTLPTALGAIYVDFQQTWQAVQGFVTGAISNIVGVFETMKTWLTSTLQGALSTFKTFLGSFTLPNPFAGLRSVIQAIPDALDSVRNKVNEIKSFLSSVSIPNPFAGITMPSMPSWMGGAGNNAAGSGFFPGGLTLVGERGPEMVMLPRGSRIESSERTARMMGGEGVTVNNYFTVAGDLDIEAAAYKIVRRIQERSR
jgi:phage-related protein